MQSDVRLQRVGIGAALHCFPERSTTFSLQSPATGRRGPALPSAFFSSRRALLSKRPRKCVSAPSRPPGPGRGTSGPPPHTPAAPARPGRGGRTPGPRGPRGQALSVHSSGSALTDTVGEPRGPASTDGTESSCGPRWGGSSGPVRGQATGREGPCLGAARRAGACFPPPPPPRALGAHTNDGRDAGPSPRTQSRRCHPGAKFPHNDASAAAILPRGRRLLTLAPTRRASAPRRAFRARTEAARPRFRAAAALRPSREHLIGCRLAISREEAEGAAAGASALPFPAPAPASAAAPASASPSPAPPPPPRPARPPERPRRPRSAGGGSRTVRWPRRAQAVGPSVPTGAQRGGKEAGVGAEAPGGVRGRVGAEAGLPCRRGAPGRTRAGGREASKVRAGVRIRASSRVEAAPPGFASQTAPCPPRKVGAAAWRCRRRDSVWLSLGAHGRGGSALRVVD